MTFDRLQENRHPLHSPLISVRGLLWALILSGCVQPGANDSVPQSAAKALCESHGLLGGISLEARANLERIFGREDYQVDPGHNRMHEADDSFNTRLIGPSDPGVILVTKTGSIQAARYPAVLDHMGFCQE